MITINVQSRTPIYEQIVERFETLIVSGVLAPDSQMPSVRALAIELSINPNTIQKAYTMLEQEGFIYPIRGRGNFVSGDETLKKKKQEGIYRSLQELIGQGKALEIPCEAFMSCVREYYERGSRSDRIYGQTAMIEENEKAPAVKRQESAIDIECECQKEEEGSQ